MSPSWFSLRVAGSAIARALVIHNRQHFPGRQAPGDTRGAEEGADDTVFIDEDGGRNRHVLAVFPRSSVQHRNRVNQLVVLIGHNCQVRKILLRLRINGTESSGPPWPPQYRLLSPRAISRATARRLTRILKKRSTGAAPMNPMNPTIIDPNIVPKINPNS